MLLITFCSDDISGFQSVWYNLSNESSMNMFWTLSEGMDCLLKKEYIQQIAFWIKTKENPHINCSDVEKWPENMYYPLSILTSGNLSLNLEESAPVQQEYCVKVQFTIYDSTRLMFYTMRSRYEVTPTTSSTMHPGMLTSVLIITDVEFSVPLLRVLKCNELVFSNFM